MHLPDTAWEPLLRLPMETPLQITFREIAQSDAVEARIREKAAKLERHYKRIMSCSVVVEATHRRGHRGRIFDIHIDLRVPGGELVVSRQPGADHAHEDIYVAIRDAFRAAERQLEDYARRQAGQTKSHEAPLHGRVAKLMAAEGYGFIETSEGLELYFHEHSVTNGAFGQLEVGSEVRYVNAAAQGDDGPQASSVTPIGKHHIVD